MRKEIDMVMAQIGCSAFEDLDASYLLASLRAPVSTRAVPQE